MCVLPQFEVHHILPVRLGGTHAVANLMPVTRAEHVQAHLDLFVAHGDPRDLCAAHMIAGRDREAHLVACAMGGVASQRAKRARGIANGFQLFSRTKRRRVAAAAGRVGGAMQVLNRMGIHVDDAAQRSAWARLGAEAVKERFTRPAAQAARGRKGGARNAGSRWYRDANAKPQKYTAAMQTKESFELFLHRTGFETGKGRSISKGSRFYNNGVEQWMFDPAKHDTSFEVFLQKNDFKKGRLK